MRKPDEHYIMYVIFSREIVLLNFFNIQITDFKIKLQKQYLEKMNNDR